MEKDIVLISGAPGGIGIGLCRKFASQGCIVAALDRDESALQRLEATLLEESGATIIPILCDLTDGQRVRDAVDRVEADHGAITRLVNNAAFITETGNLKSMTPDKWEIEISVNLNGAYNLSAPVLDHMVTRGAGVITTISSVNGLAAFGHPAYSASKAGLISHMQSVAIEYGPRGIRANCVLPGTVATDAWQARIDKEPNVFELLKKWYPLGTVATPEDVAEAVWFLSSPAARVITGTCLRVDAGLMAGNRLMAQELSQDDFS
jgi:NAD(P)-dependent dehydrogenase (short-subunit alcohol dehydrogenase family)